MSPTRPTRAVALAVVPAAALLLTACGDDGGGQPEDVAEVVEGGLDGGGATVRVGHLTTESFAPLIVAAEMFAEDYNLTIELSNYPSGGEVMAVLATGGLEVGGTGVGAASYTAYDEGLPFEFVAPLHSGFTEDYFTLSGSLVDSEEEAAALAEDLSAYAGETFTTNAPGVMTEWMLGDALERTGLSIDDVRIDTMPFPDMVPALASGAVVAAVASEPAATRAENEGSGFRPWQTPTDEEPVLISAVMYNSDWSADNPEQAAAFMAAYADAVDYFLENGWKDEEILRILAETADQDPAVLAETRSHHVTEGLEVNFDTLREYQQFYLETGSLDLSEPIDDRELWNFAWRDAVLDAR